MGEAGVEIAGGSSGTVFKNVARYVEQYGGKAVDWVKKSSSRFTARDGKSFESHWVENVKTGQRVEPKTIIEK